MNGRLITLSYRVSLPLPSEIKPVSDGQRSSIVLNMRLRRRVVGGGFGFAAIRFATPSFTLINQSINLIWLHSQ
jgi:hypothetical protein